MKLTRGIAVSVVLHLVLAVVFLLKLPLPQTDAAKEDAVSVELVEPPKPPEPEKKQEPEKKARMPAPKQQSTPPAPPPPTSAGAPPPPQEQAFETGSQDERLDEPEGAAPSAAADGNASTAPKPAEQEAVAKPVPKPALTPAAIDMLRAKMQAAEAEQAKEEAKAELATIDKMGGAVAAIDYMKRRLVESGTGRLSQIESGELTVVGVNRFKETEPSPLSGGTDAIMVVDPAVEAEQIGRLKAWKANRDGKKVAAALAEVERAAKEDINIMDASIAAAKAGVTTGEWGTILRKVFGEYRAPTGVAQAAVVREGAQLATVRESVNEVSDRLGRRIKFLVGKPGLDGHSNGAEQIAVRARDVGMEVVYEGIRLTPAQIVRAAVDEAVHVVGLSILSGSHVPLVKDVMERMRKEGLDDVPVIVGGIIPPADEKALKAFGVAAVYTPKDFQLNDIMADIVQLVDQHTSAAA